MLLFRSLAIAKAMVRQLFRFFVTIIIYCFPNHGTSGKELSMYCGSFALPNNTSPPSNSSLS